MKWYPFGSGKMQLTASAMVLYLRSAGMLTVLCLAGYGVVEYYATPENIRGELRDAENHAAIDSAWIELCDERGQAVYFTSSDQNGTFEFKVQRMDNYLILIHKPGYLERVVNKGPKVYRRKNVVLFIPMKKQ